MSADNRIPNFDSTFADNNLLTISSKASDLPTGVKTTISPLAPTLPSFPDPADELFITGNADDTGNVLFIRGLDESFKVKELVVSLLDMQSNTVSIGSGWSRINNLVNAGEDAIVSDLLVKSSDLLTSYRSFSADTQVSNDGWYTTPASGRSVVLTVFGSVLRDNNQNGNCVFYILAKAAHSNHFREYLSFGLSLRGTSATSFVNPLTQLIDYPLDIVTAAEPSVSNTEVTARISALKEL